MFKRKLFLLIMIAAVPLVFLWAAGCEEAEDPLEDLEAEEEAEEEVLVDEDHEIKDDLLTIGVGRDFYYGTEDRTYLHGSTNVWEGLVYLDEDLEPEPWLAEEITASEDGKTWTFRLREGVTFHDGEYFDSEAARANIIRLSEHPQTADSYKYMESVKAIDTYTLEIELDRPLPAFPVLISYFPSAMFSPAAIDADGTGLKGPIGTGPYQFDRYGEDKIFLQAYEDYWKGEPKVGSVIFHHIPDQATRVSALQAGEVDALVDVGIILPEQVPELENVAGIELKTQQVLTSIYMFFQTESEPVANPAIRRAISMLLDREELVDSLLDGYGEPGRAVITPLAEFWLDDELIRYEHDPEEAKRLLEANFPEGEKVHILVNSSWAARWPMASIAQYLLTELNKLGIEAEIETIEMGAYSEKVQQGDFHVSFCPWTGQDPDDFFSSWILTNAGFNQSRGVEFSSAEADQLIEAAVQEVDRDKRRQLYLELQDLVEEESPLVPVYHDLTVYGVRDYVKDLEMDFNFRPDLFKVSLE